MAPRPGLGSLPAADALNPGIDSGEDGDGGDNGDCGDDGDGGDNGDCGDGGDGGDCGDDGDGDSTVVTSVSEWSSL